MQETVTQVRMGISLFQLTQTEVLSSDPVCYECRDPNRYRGTNLKPLLRFAAFDFRRI